MALPQSLYRNKDRYLGETIDIHAVLDEIERHAIKSGWQIRHFLDRPGTRLTALHRESPNCRTRIYLSAGIHGDEPAGPLAVLELIKANRWPNQAGLWVVPCLNPTGFPINTRTNAAGQDLNRDYRQPVTAEVQAHTRWLDQLPDFDVAFCLHEDWEARGFYLYELNATGRISTAGTIIEKVAGDFPIDPSKQIDGRPARRGIIRANSDPASRPEWPEAFYLFQHKTKLSYTLEAPSDFDLPVRVRALVAAVNAALGCWCAHRPGR